MGVEKKTLKLRAYLKRVSEYKMLMTATIQEDDQQPFKVSYYDRDEVFDNATQQLIEAGWELESQDTIGEETILVFTRIKK